MPLRTVVTCEHGANRIPRRHESLFAGAASVLASHRGWDPGALALARWLAAELRAPLRYSLTTRLLVDLNRGKASPTLFSEFSRALPENERFRLLVEYHDRYWRRVVRVIDPWIRSGDRALHVSVHSFTPVWEGRDREVDVGVLFDPARPLEASLARAWVDELRRRLPELRTKPNEPYHGAADGLTTGLRRRYSEQRYFGLELEVTQRITRRSSPERRSVYRRIVEALLAVRVRETRSVGGGE